MDNNAYVYIMANRYRGTMYVGITNNLARRVHEHKTGTGSRFVARYALDRLVYYEPHDWIEGAIQRESQIKAWKRDWKIELVESLNPDWKDLESELV
ncbi:MAG: GIY-YIG nuclease family protein [Pseudomonadaceae bacterium]|nr:GIY-YIG nuclease family protein [Pseudomonadaceae bacterium]